MIGDQVRHKLDILPQIFEVFPTPQAGIDPLMINRIKTGIDAVNWIIEWEDMNAAEQTAERSF